MLAFEHGIIRVTSIQARTLPMVVSPVTLNLLAFGVSLFPFLNGVELPPVEPLTHPLEIAQQFDKPPVGYVDPQQPIQITLTNSSQADLTVQLTQPPSSERLLESGRSLSFGTTHTSYLPPPVYLFVSSNRQNIRIDMTLISTRNNRVEIAVGVQKSAIPGEHTLAIGQNGSIYIY